jgi:hypothetical protein
MAHELARAGALWLLRSRIRLAWRRLLLALGLRRITPRDGEPRPARLVVVEPLGDTGGAYRPKHRPQDPAKDPDEPWQGESSSRGSDHGWSNCTMSSGADAIAYATRGELVPWGGRLRHEQGDLDGGTDLYDLRAAFAALGEELTIRSGAGWGAVVDAHEAGRAIVIQGEGDTPGAGDFTGGHACAIGIETASDGRWLFGDPVVSDWQWIQPSAIRTWAERWQSSIAFATTIVVVAPEPEPPEPEPPKPPAAPCYSRAELELHVAEASADAVTAAGDELVGAWLDWLEAPEPSTADRWDRGSWSDPAVELEELIAGRDPDPCAELVPASWSRGGLLEPVSDALAAYLVPASWDRSSWRAAAWLEPLASAGRRSS